MTSVEVCTDLSAKELCRKVGINRMIVPGHLNSLMVRAPAPKIARNVILQLPPNLVNLQTTALNQKLAKSGVMGGVTGK